MGKRPFFFGPLYFGFTELGLGLGAGFLAAFFTGLWAADFHAPLRPTADYVFALFNIKTLLRFGDVHANPAMAFPGMGHFEAFPLPDALGHIIVRLLALFSSDPIWLLLAMLAVCFVGVTLSAYLALRLTRIDRLAAFLGAFVYGTSAHMVERAHVHPWLCVMFAIPWVCRLCVLMPYQRARLGQKPLELSVWGALAIGFAGALSGIYWAFFDAFFLAAALLLLLVQRAPYRRFKAGLVALGSTLGFFLILALPLLVLVVQRGESFPDRNLFFQPMYGLRLPDIFIPNLPFLTGFYDRFHALQERIADEGDYTMLGLWGIAGLLTGVWYALKRLVPHAGDPRLYRREPLLRLSLFFILLGILFAVPYGLGFIFNMLFTGAIRSQVRIGAYLLPFALMMAPVFLDSLRRRMRKEAFVSLVVLLALLTSSPNFWAVAEDQKKTLDVWEARKTSLINTIAAMDRSGVKKIAQYPSIYFPEGPSTPAFGNTDYFWPYIMDAATDRHWSFGSMVFEPNWSRLASAFREPTSSWLHELALMGFDAALMEKDAMTPAEIQHMEPLRAAPYASDLIYEDKHRLLIRIPQNINLESPTP